jgi:hypothetical protein
MDYKLLNVILEGLSDSNIRFQALTNLLKNLNFSHRVKGNHYIFFKDRVEEIINLQPLKNAKGKGIPSKTSAQTHSQI